jgi:anti-sigma factor RsiW
MPEHMSDKLNAFLDGELDVRAQSEVLAHLETCQSCTDELEALRRVSQILRAAPQPGFTPAKAFTDRLMTQLPSREEALPQDTHTANWLLWLAPVIVLAGWIFMQVSLNLTGLITLAGRAGILEGTLAWAAGSPQQTQWFAAAQSVVEGVLGMQVPSGFGILNDASVFASSLVTPLLWQAGAAVLYWAAIVMVMSGRLSAQQVSSKLD